MVKTKSDGQTCVDFRDCIVDVEQGAVLSYYDKQVGVYLRPEKDHLDNWSVFTESGEATGQIWRGIIAFDGAQLLIQQARNSLFRLYRTDGSIETQLRMSRVIEQPGKRKLLFPQDQWIEEDLQSGTRTTFWGDRTVVREADGTVRSYDLDGVQLWDVNDADSDAQYDPAVVHPVLTAFAGLLHSWQDFCMMASDEEYYYGGPPGLCETFPGYPFARPVDGKAEDIREVYRHDFHDGTVLYEYLGRLNGAPFMAHELVTHDHAVLARTVEYDQPKKISFSDQTGIVRAFENVLKVEVQFEPSSCDYVSCISDAAGNKTVHPKGASFERLDGPA